MRPDRWSRRQAATRSSAALDPVATSSWTSETLPSVTTVLARLVPAFLAIGFPTVALLKIATQPRAPGKSRCSTVPPAAGRDGSTGCRRGSAIPSTVAGSPSCSETRWSYRTATTDVATVVTSSDLGRLGMTVRTAKDSLAAIFPPAAS
jgi:hypothetical protein